MRAWLAWQERPRKSNRTSRQRKIGNLTKVPLNEQGRECSSGDPKNWMTRAQAEVAAAQLRGAGKRGVGIAVGKITEKQALIAWDLDAATLENGEPRSWARDIIERSGSYAERSPSGQGFRVLLRMTVADHAQLLDLLGRKGWTTWQIPEPPAASGKRPAIELHLARRYVTVTGNALARFRRPIAAASFDDLARIVADLDGRLPRIQERPQEAEAAARGAAPSGAEEPSIASPEEQGTRPRPPQPRIGNVDHTGFLRVEPAKLAEGAERLPDVALQIDVALAAATGGGAGRQQRRSCPAILPLEHMLQLPGRYGRPRSKGAIVGALQHLEAQNRQRVVVKHRRPRGGVAGRAAERDLPWLHTFSASQQPTPKLRLARAFLREVARLDDDERRLVLLLVARFGLTPAEAFAVSAERLSRDLAASLDGQRAPSPETLSAALRRLVAAGWLVLDQPPAGRAPGRFAFGPRVFCPP